MLCQDNTPGDSILSSSQRPGTPERRINIDAFP